MFKVRLYVCSREFILYQAQPVESHYQRKSEKVECRDPVHQACRRSLQGNHVARQVKEDQDNLKENYAGLDLQVVGPLHRCVNDKRHKRQNVAEEI